MFNGGHATEGTRWGSCLCMAVALRAGSVAGEDMPESEEGVSGGRPEMLERGRMPAGRQSVDMAELGISSACSSGTTCCRGKGEGGGGSAAPKGTRCCTVADCGLQQRIC